MWKILTFVLVLFLYSSVSDKGFGPFDMQIMKIMQCKGPKRLECGLMNITLAITNKTLLHVRVTTSKNVPKFEIKVKGISSGRQAMRLELRSACENIVIRAVFESVLKLNDKCEVEKGTYEDVIDVHTISHKFFGGQFIYGLYSFKFIFQSNNCNHYCSIINIRFYPKAP